MEGAIRFRERFILLASQHLCFFDLTEALDLFVVQTLASALHERHRARHLIAAVQLRTHFAEDLSEVPEDFHFVHSSLGPTSTTCPEILAAWNMSSSCVISFRFASTGNSQLNVRKTSSGDTSAFSLRSSSISAPDADTVAVRGAEFLLRLRGRR